MIKLLLYFAILLFLYSAYFTINLVDHIKNSINRNYFDRFYIISFLQAVITIIAGFVILHVYMKGSLDGGNKEVRTFEIRIRENKIEEIYEVE